MKDFNERTALNRRLQEAVEATEREANEARSRQMIRGINRAYRESVTAVAIDAALVGAGLTGCVAAAVRLISLAV